MNAPYRFVEIYMCDGPPEDEQVLVDNALFVGHSEYRRDHEPTVIYVLPLHFRTAAEHTEALLRARRAFHRMMRPTWREQSEARDADAGFDGGEWSGPAHDRIFEELWEKGLRYVAERFGLHYAELEHEVHCRDGDEHRHLISALFDGKPPAPTCTDPAMHEKFADRGIEEQCPHCLVSSDPSRLEI